MSKIQKALQRLQSDKDKVRPASLADPRPDDSVGFESGIAPPSQRPRSTNGEVYNSPEIASEITKIDVDALIENGLMAREADIETVAQEFRRIKRPVLKTAFSLSAPDAKNANVIMIASALPQCGKTFCAINLATSIARERDFGAVLVDADVLKPNISRVMALESRAGLIDYLLDSTVQIDDVLINSDLHGIIIVPAGRQHPEATELLASRRMEKFVAELSARFRDRAVIVDTPPLLLTNEAHVLSHHMGQIVFVIEAGVSTQESVMQALESLDPDMPINAVLNKSRGGSFLEYGKGAYYDYGYHSIPPYKVEE